MIVVIIIAIVFLLCVVLCVDYFIANEFYEVAVLKGYSKEKYYWLCFCFTVVGYLLVIALPTKIDKEKQIQIDDECVENDK